MKANNSTFSRRTGSAAGAKLIFADILTAILPSAFFGLLIALIFGRARGDIAISTMITVIFGYNIESVDEINLLMSLIYFTPPLLQLIFLGDRIPRELSGGVYALTRTKARTLWLVKKLLRTVALSLLMSISMLLVFIVYARISGAAADALLPLAFFELMASWGLCQCMLVVFCNIVGMLLKPLYLLMLSLVLCAMGLVLSVGGGETAKLFPTVQGILYAHNSIFGRTQEGFFTPLFSALYQTAVIFALALLGALRIRRKDVL